VTGCPARGDGRPALCGRGHRPLVGHRSRRDAG